MRAMEKDFLDFVHLVMESDAGINRKVGVNTLARSDLYQTAWTLAQEGGGSLVVNIMLRKNLEAMTLDAIALVLGVVALVVKTIRLIKRKGENE